MAELFRGATRAFGRSILLVTLMDFLRICGLGNRRRTRQTRRAYFKLVLGSSPRR
ncbi:hypothetical protein OG21DRAFT_1337720 [Imleria badia]|nr:hypothetical protein OG21DRAFT_1337720 [Imleria badia]